MEATKKTKKVVPESSFNRGWSQIPPCYRDEVRQKLMAVFGILTISQFYARMRGEVEPRKSQIEGVQAVFAQFNVTDIWGLEPFNNSNS